MGYSYTFPFILFHFVLLAAKDRNMKTKPANHDRWSQWNSNMGMRSTVSSVCLVCHLTSSPLLRKCVHFALGSLVYRWSAPIVYMCFAVSSWTFSVFVILMSGFMQRTFVCVRFFFVSTSCVFALCVSFAVLLCGWWLVAGGFCLHSIFRICSWSCKGGNISGVFLLFFLAHKTVAHKRQNY